MDMNTQIHEILQKSSCKLRKSNKKNNNPGMSIVKFKNNCTKASGTDDQ